MCVCARVSLRAFVQHSSKIKVSGSRCSLISDSLSLEGPGGRRGWRAAATGPGGRGRAWLLGAHGLPEQSRQGQRLSHSCRTGLAMAPSCQKGGSVLGGYDRSAPKDLTPPAAIGVSHPASIGFSPEGSRSQLRKSTSHETYRQG